MTRYKTGGSCPSKPNIKITSNFIRLNLIIISRYRNKKSLDMKNFNFVTQQDAHIKNIG